MSIINVNFKNKIGKMKPMHAVNNGPIVAGADQTRGNQNEYKACRIPYARTHDASFYAGYGGNHTVDVNFIFTDFDADVNDPGSYDFACTDEYMEQIIKYGAKPYFRLGSRIEHEIKKYGTHVPKDFLKWAQICEHIIAHYTEGWANGFRYDMEYWEIWNEPDLDPDDSKNKRCWQGTEVQFAEFFSVASKYLKKRFPNLKIGGPASAGDEAWMARFLERIKKNDAPLDFFSYHWYWTDPYDLSNKCTKVRKLLDDAGYKGVETHINEWNYVRGWTDEFVYSIKQIIGIKGAAFTSACMSICQNNPAIDMLMYYDARPGTFNGLFDYYTMEPLKGYYPFYIFANLYEMENQIKTESDDKDIYVIGASNNEKCALMVTYYSENDNEGAKKVTIKLNGFDASRLKFYLVDERNTYMPKSTYKIENDEITMRLERNSIVYIEG